jgi:outer membrane biosynthesis protein TonB
METGILRFGFAAAALALFGCGDPAQTAGAPAPGGTGGVTIELPEPEAPAARPPVPEPPKPEAALEPAKAEIAPPPAAKAPPEAPKQEPAKAEVPAPEAAPKADAPPEAGESSPLPLSAPVVARTIERIGYPCGAVASSSRIEAPAGETAYRITCTSGDSYRASDRSGRFRFRKLDP